MTAFEIMGFGGSATRYAEMTNGENENREIQEEEQSRLWTNDRRTASGAQTEPRKIIGSLRLSLGNNAPIPFSFKNHHILNSIAVTWGFNTPFNYWRLNKFRRTALLYSFNIFVCGIPVQQLSLIIIPGRRV
jgi:hypothetical protein